MFLPALRAGRKSTVSGAGSQWISVNGLAVGLGGTGTLSILEGGKASFVDRIDAGERSFPMQKGAVWRLSHAHVRDVAHAVLLCAEQPANGYRVFNLSEATTPTMRERVETIAELMNARITWNESEELPEGLESLGAMPNDLVVDSTRIRDTLGFAEVSTPEQRIEDAITWARQSR